MLEGRRLFDLSRVNGTNAFENAPDIRRFRRIWKPLGDVPLSQSRQALLLQGTYRVLASVLSEVPDDGTSSGRKVSAGFRKAGNCR